jgi:hypothetical protein
MTTQSRRKEKKGMQIQIQMQYHLKLSTYIRLQSASFSIHHFDFLQTVTEI